MHTTTELARRAMDDADAEARRKHAELFARVMGRVHRYFARVVRPRDQADDCLQQTLLLVEESLRRRTYDPDRSFNTWLWLKARTVYAQHCRARAGRRLEPDTDLAERAPSRREEDPAHSIDARRLLAHVSDRLGEETYEIFVLYYEGQLTHEEIAEITGRDRKTVRRRIASAHAAVERLLRREKA